MGNRKYSERRFLEAIDGSGAIISTIADRVGCSWETAKKWVTDAENHPKLVELYTTEEQRMNDLARATILTSIKNGNTQDAKWWLARKARQEFGDNIDVTSGNDPIKFTVTYEDELTGSET